PDNIKKLLKSPWGELVKTPYLESLRGKKVISIGDVSTLNCLAYSIKPFIAVFDFKFMRKDLHQNEKAVLLKSFPKLQRALNPAGTISKEFVLIAKKLLPTGGAILVDGEEDLTALVFMALNSDFYILYGQPNEGVVVVTPENREIKEKAKIVLEELGII
ncbi:DUF359 domain-containing protein, partial [Candidatus Micrarchaeota archaeon]|nr:DUF359 domain-containing protein [Candidatus Micrarchaeota archaeon]